MLFVIIAIFAAFILYLYINDKILRKKELEKLMQTHNIIKQNKNINNIPEHSYLVRINLMSEPQNECAKYKNFYIWKIENTLYLQEINIDKVQKNSNKICLPVENILFFEISKEPLKENEIIDYIASDYNNAKLPIARKIENIIKTEEKQTYIAENKKIYVYYLDNDKTKAISLISKNYNTLKNLIPDKELSYLEKSNEKANTEILKIIEELHVLKEKNIISEDEFTKHKERLLNKI